MHATRLPWLVVGSVLGTAAFPRAARPSDVAESPRNYVVALFGTTLAYRPPQGPLDGPQRDVSVGVGYGRYITATIALELDLGPTFVRGRYANLSFVPGVVWSPSPWWYAAARFVVPVDPALDVAAAPGIGVFHTFDNDLTLSLEWNVSSYVGRGNPDAGVSLTAGALYSF